jgi:ABC-2 type transport system permease protein
MSTRSYAAKDSATMLRRNLRHTLRYPSMTVSVVGMPIIMLLMFVDVFGGAMSASLAGAPDTGVTYINYVVPGILVMTVGSGSMPTAVAVCTDMTEGIVNRFRTMAISRSSILTGHVVGSMIQTMVSAGLVIGVSLLMGFRPTSDPVRWVAAITLLALLTLALTWLAVALGLVTRTLEAASNVVMPLFLLPFVSSAFVPLATMPAGVRWFAQHQPFTPVIDTLRELLTGAPIGSSGVIAVAWCGGIALAGYLWARTVFNRGPAS